MLLVNSVGALYCSKGHGYVYSDIRSSGGCSNWISSESQCKEAATLNQAFVDDNLGFGFTANLGGNRPKGCYRNGDNTYYFATSGKSGCPANYPCVCNEKICIKCPPGYYSNGGNVTCTKCQEGTLSVANASKCIYSDEWDCYAPNGNFTRVRSCEIKTQIVVNKLLSISGVVLNATLPTLVGNTLNQNCDICRPVNSAFKVETDSSLKIAHFMVSQANGDSDSCASPIVEVSDNGILYLMDVVFTGNSSCIHGSIINTGRLPNMHLLNTVLNNKVKFLSSALSTQLGDVRFTSLDGVSIRNCDFQSGSIQGGLIMYEADIGEYSKNPPTFIAGISDGYYKMQGIEVQLVEVVNGMGKIKLQFIGSGYTGSQNPERTSNLLSLYNSKSSYNYNTKNWRVAYTTDCNNRPCYVKNCSSAPSMCLDMGSHNSICVDRPKAAHGVICSENCSIGYRKTGIFNHKCKRCVHGKFSDEWNQYKCKNWRNCTPGSYVVTNGTSISNRVCQRCATGKFSLSLNTHCIKWSTCPRGSFISQNGTNMVDRVCTVCVPGLFSMAWNQFKCNMWSDCPKGTYISANGSSTSNRNCTSCPLGKFSASTNAFSCTQWNTCVPGQMVAVNGTATNNRQCNTCPHKTFSVAENVFLCSNWIKCNTNETEISSGSAKADRICALPQVVTEPSEKNNTLTTTTSAPLNQNSSLVNVDNATTTTTTFVTEPSEKNNTLTTTTSAPLNQNSSLVNVDNATTTTGVPQRRSARFPSGDPLDDDENELSWAPSSYGTQHSWIVLFMCVQASLFAYLG